MEQSILKTIKQLIGCPDDFEQFDLDLTIHINSAFAALTQLGVGPKEGYRITGPDNVWSEFDEDAQKIGLVKDYVYIKTRLLFDPPTSGSLMDSLKEQLPVFLKPKQLNNKDSVSELVFAHKSVEIRGGKGGVIDTDSGHRSRVDYRAPSLNAYDSGRLSRGLFDEGAKWPKEVPFSTFISIVSKTLVKGVKRVGFIECPSTTNAMDKGGSEFKLVWENADQNKYERTPNRLVKYMTPAYDGYLGFIDKYGESVIDAPTEEQYKYLVENFAGIGDLS